MKLLDLIVQKRTSMFKNVLDFNFNKKRVRLLTDTDDISQSSRGVLYWITRDQRVKDK
jgi:deoxyribodipyrimidine photo-lyase